MKCCPVTELHDKLSIHICDKLITINLFLIINHLFNPQTYVNFRQFNSNCISTFNLIYGRLFNVKSHLSTAD